MLIKILARSCFGSARIWRMNMPTIWLYETVVYEALGSTMNVRGLVNDLVFSKE